MEAHQGLSQELRDEQQKLTDVVETLCKPETWFEDV